MESQLKAKTTTPPPPKKRITESIITTEIDGLTISTKVSGSGPPLVFYHGWIGNEDTFGMCHEAFARHFTVYRPAWPGYGGSTPLPHFTFEDFIELGRKYIEKLNLGKITLVGNCLGGNIAMEVVQRYPELIERLILIEVHAYFPKYLYPLLIPKFNAFLYRTVFKTATGFNFLNSFLPLQQSNGNNGWLYTWEGFERTRVESALDFLSAIHRFSKGRFAAYRKTYRTDIPVFYVEGGKSFGPIGEFGKLVHTYFRNLTVISIPESLHNPVVEKPEIFNERVLRALGLEP
jgi:pimeloyl-ACP methyl ester carboxylesterase